MSKTATPVDLNALARDAFTADLGFDAAADFMLGKIEAAEGQFGPAGRSAARRGCREMYFDLRHHELTRVKVRHGNNVPTPAALAARIAAIETVERGKLQRHVQGILDGWTLPNGKRLGDATGRELAAIATEEANLAHGHGLNAAFYAAVADRAGESIVRSVLSEEDAADLWKQVKGTSVASQSTRDTPTPVARRRGTNGHARPNGNGKAKGTNGADYSISGTQNSSARPNGSKR